MTFEAQVTQEDVKAIRQMVQSAGVFSKEEIDVAEELALDAAALGAESHYRFIFAEIEEEMAGYTCFGRIPLTDERYDLYWIVTDKAALRNGIATELMKRTREAVKAIGGKAIYAETSSRAIYTPAQKFYLKNGFTLAARVKDFYSNGDDKLLYCLRIE